MADEIRRSPPHPPAVVRTPGRRRRFSIIWIVPIMAVAIGAWLAWDTLSKQGPVITVSFQSAEGLQAGQSQLKFKDIVFGTVQSFSLAPDRKHVNVRIATTNDAEPLLTDRTVFWVVKPRLFAGNISGLDTLLSGSYVAMLPPEAGVGRPKRDFVGLEDPPVLESQVPGRTFLLKADRLGSISLGSPIYFRDFAVGEVLGWELGDMAQNVTIHAFVRSPFDKYVHDNSRFWNASGLSVKLGGGGVQVELESLKALLLGGIAFETPDGDAAGALSADERAFPLYANKEVAQNASYDRSVSLVSYFSGSVRGLVPGADVTLHGLKIGEVKSVTLTYDPAQDAILAPVRYEVQPGRFFRHRVKADTAEAVDELVQHGLRATLQSANLITGQMLIALDFMPDAPPATVKQEGDTFVFPTVDSGGFAGLEASASALLAKVNNIPFGELGKNLNKAVAGLSAAVSGPELKQAVASLTSTLNTVQDTIRKLDAGLSPAAKRLPEIAAELQTTMVQTNKLMLSLQSGYGDNTRFNRDLERLLVEASDAVRSIRSLADLLTRHPEVLVRGRTNQGAE